jgi:excisionase family DNA binding protein
MPIVFVRIREAQRRLGLGRSTVYRLIKEGQLGPFVKIIPGDVRSPSALLDEHVTGYQEKVIALAVSAS